MEYIVNTPVYNVQQSIKYQCDKIRDNLPVLLPVCMRPNKFRNKAKKTTAIIPEETVEYTESFAAKSERKRCVICGTIKTPVWRSDKYGYKWYFVHLLQFFFFLFLFFPLFLFSFLCVYVNLNTNVYVHVYTYS